MRSNRNLIVGRLAAALVLAGMVFGLVACHTVAGVGEDINAAGRAITRAAN
ncbi:entericidin A/B family lipoprotein [Burkholderia gladioli]|uniref:entericidin A/B family lipoprotein n=1 Tax=Burkholderia gladioli TaxID=28095 RepID=UPI003017C93A